MNNIESAIGVFDSGMGGLTVLRALRKQLPLESFIYLGDTARLPYGTKSADTVKQYAMQMAQILVERQIKALVIACNTATTAALDYLQQMLPDIPVMGVVQPGASAAISATRNGKILVLATETTIASNAYQNTIKNQLPQAEIRALSCSLLIALAEEGMVDNSVARQALLHYLSSYQNEDTILLGCTHFPVFKKSIQNLVPADIAIVDSAQATAYALKDLLSDNNILNQQQSNIEIDYLATDSTARFQRVGEVFLGESLPMNKIELVDVKR